MSTTAQTSAQSSGLRLDQVTDSSGDLWAEAFNALSVEDQKQFDNPKGNLLDVLKNVWICPLKKS
jgi:hypothetical protein